VNYVALRMLTVTASKYLSLIFAIAAFMLENQSSIFAGIMKWPTITACWTVGR